MRSIRRSAPVLALALAAGTAWAPQTAAPATAAVDATEACEVTAATLTWGFKESFRSYISGTIASGTWETSGGATYETPNFSWTTASGSFLPSNGSGQIDFTGAIRFTGHGGILDTTVSNPIVSIDDATSGRIAFDLTGITMEQAMGGTPAEPETVAAVPLVDLDLTGGTMTQDGPTLTYTVTGAPSAITAEGFEAFGNYPAGTAFDPVSLSVTANCPLDEPEPEPTASALDAVDADDSAPASGQEALPVWIPWTIGGVVALAVAAVVTTLAVRRRRGDAS